MQTSEAAPAVGPFEQLPQLLGYSNGCPRTSKRQICFAIPMLVVVIKAANISSAAAAVRFSPLSAAAHNVSRFVLGAEFLPLYHSAVAKASSATPSPHAPPRQPLLLLRPLLLLLLLLLLVSILRKFLKVKNRLSVVMTSSSLSSLLHTRCMAECICVGSMGGGELAVIMALILCVTGHLMGRQSSAGCGGRRCCSNVLRELALFVSDRPTQQQLRVFIFTKTAVKSHIRQKVPANRCTWPVTHRPVSVFSKKIWKYLVGYNSIRSP